MLQTLYAPLYHINVTLSYQNTELEQTLNSIV